MISTLLKIEKIGQTRGSTGGLGFFTINTVQSKYNWTRNHKKMTD